MKKYTQEEFDAIPVIIGIKMCPTGDYTNITIFGESCSFGEWCRFGEQCSFGEQCRFGESCSFGEGCSFGESCSFGEWCRFGGQCSYCKFKFNKMVSLNGLLPWPVRIYINTTKKEYYLSVGCENFASMEEMMKDNRYVDGWSELVMPIVKYALEESK